jgi:hypothetical protein
MTHAFVFLTAFALFFISIEWTAADAVKSKSCFTREDRDDYLRSHRKLNTCVWVTAALIFALGVL